jgi:methyl-accepting chemotaxis protein
MKGRRVRLGHRLQAGTAITVAGVCYLAAGIALLVLFAVSWIFAAVSPSGQVAPFFNFFRSHAVIPFAAVTVIGLIAVAVLLFKCRQCRIGPVKRISSAMEKMSQGDLGWKITLRRGDELAEIADSVTRASCSLADRIGKLQTHTRELTEVENYLIDTVETDRVANPHLMKALRRMKICTHRLHCDIEDFQLSTITLPHIQAVNRPPVHPAAPADLPRSQPLRDRHLVG